MVKFRVIAVSLAFVVTAAACGDDDGTPTPDAATSDGAQADGASADAPAAVDAAPPDAAAMMVNGCTLATATDMTGDGDVTISDVSAWTLGHAACIVVAAGSTVTWNGNFVAHPLDGGATPTTDATSPITMAVDNGASTAVTFAAVGDYPYFETATPCVGPLRRVLAARPRRVDPEAGALVLWTSAWVLSDRHQQTTQIVFHRSTRRRA